MQVKHSTLDLDRARDIGLKLQAGRESLNLPASKVANILLLSRHQVESLEAGDASVFYNAQFYAQAADKYAAFLEHTSTPSETLFEQTASADAEPVPAVEAPANVTKPIDPHARAARNQRIKGVVLLAVWVAVAAGVYTQRDAVIALWPQTNVAPAPEKPATPELAPVAAPVAPAPPVVEAPAPVVSIATGTVVFRFSGSSWVQVVAADGRKQDHTYKAGDTLSIEPAKLQALIIGNAQVVTAESAKGAVNLQAHVSPGSKVARMIGPAIRGLGQ